MKTKKATPRKRGKYTKGPEIPAWAYRQAPIDPPTKTVVVSDHEALCELLLKQQFVTLRVDPTQTRISASGSQESPEVKNLNSFMRNAKGIQLFTRRLTADEWLVFIAPHQPQGE